MTAPHSATGGKTPGELIGVGVGPGDPMLITVAGAEAIRNADVVAYHHSPEKPSKARLTAAPYIQPGTTELKLTYPVTVQRTQHPQGYAGAMAEFYLTAAQRIAAYLDEGKNVVVISLGDPMLYSSYQHLHRALRQDYPTRIIPGIPSITAAADLLGEPLAEDDEVLTVLTGTMDQQRLVQELSTSDTAVIMKLGRTWDKVKAALAQTGLLERTSVVCKVGLPDQKTIPAHTATAADIPYLSVAIVPSRTAQKPNDTGASGVDERTRQLGPGEPSDKPPAPAPTAAHITPVTTSAPGEVVVVGLGPGAEQWTTPEVTAELEHATDLVGYSTYINRVPQRAGQARHLSDNKVEAERAEMALDLARRGHRVAVVSSGDPGVFAMAAAVLEVAERPEWRGVPVRIVPGMTAAQAVASRAGAPLGHDFGMISLSNRLKPWEQIEKRLRALFAADMAFAVYNPASKERREHIRKLAELARHYRDGDTPVIVAKAVGSPREQVVVTTVEKFDPEVVDMRTMVIMGASTTRAYTDGAGSTRVYTSRYYDTNPPAYGS